MLLRMTAREDSLENTVKTKESLERRTAGERGLAADERDIGISEKNTPSLQFKMCSKFAMFCLLKSVLMHSQRSEGCKGDARNGALASSQRWLSVVSKPIC